MRNNFYSNLPFSQDKTTTSNNRTRGLIPVNIVTSNNGTNLKTLVLHFKSCKGRLMRTNEMMSGTITDEAVPTVKFFTGLRGYHVSIAQG